jgi:hypothetical protein
MVTAAPAHLGNAPSLIWTALVGLFRSRASLAAEILVLRHQINIQSKTRGAKKEWKPRTMARLFCIQPRRLLLNTDPRSAKPSGA